MSSDRKSMLNGLAVLSLALLVSACGIGDGSNELTPDNAAMVNQFPLEDRT